MSINNTNIQYDLINQEFSKAEKIFFIGIGGISMSSLAELCALMGKKVYGYDRERNDAARRLEKIGRIKYYSTPDNVTGMDMVIYTSAIDESNHEYRQAKRLGILTLSRANFLGYIISLYKVQIGVCGMHGKSTTTAMLSHIFDTACENPTVFCGAKMKSGEQAHRFGGREYCIFEACEYKRAFLSLPSTDVAVLNIDYDHPDYFTDMEDIKSAFDDYIKRAKRVFLNCDDENCRQLCHKSIVTFGFGKNATYRAEMLKEEICDTGSAFLVYKRGQLLCKCTLSSKGRHLVLDSLCAFAVSHSYGIATEVICRALSTFEGSHRRMEFIKKSDTGADIFEDYAHHPAEIASSLSALREMGYMNILCVFQPHTFSRSYYLYDRFKACFADARELIVAPTFSAREENVFELSEEKFATDCGGVLIRGDKEIAERIRTAKNDCIVLMGAGDLSGRIKNAI